MEIKDIESGGSIVIADIDQSFLSLQMLEAVSNVGTGAEIISEISNISKAEIEKGIETAQKAETEEIGTLDAAGTAISGIVDTVISGWTNLLQTGALTVLIPILLVGAVVLFMFRGTIAKVAEKKMGVAPSRPMMRPMMRPMRPMMRGGAKSIKSLYKKVMSFITKYSKKAMKYGTMKNLIILVISIIVIVVIYKGYQLIRYNRIEGFTAESKNTDLTISHDGMFLKNKKLGDDHLCFQDDKEKAYKFDISIINDKDIYIVTNIGDKKFYLRTIDDEIIIEPYDFINDSSYKFQFTKIEDKYSLSQGDKKITVKDDCLVVGEKATELLFA